MNRRIPANDLTLRANRRGAIWASGIVGILLILSGCDAPAGSSNEIVVGHYASMTGSEATFGRSTDNGIRLAIDEINATGGVHGKPVRIITYDDKGDARETGTAVTRLIAHDNVVAVLGEVSSSLSLVGAPVCQEYGVPMVTPSSTNPAITEVGDKIFRVCFTNAFQAYVCAKFAFDHERLRARRAAILYDQVLAYSQDLQAGFEEAFTGMGGEIVTKQVYQAGDQDFSAQLTAIRGTQPDVVFVPGYYTDVGNIALQARKLGLDVPFLGGDGWDSSKLGEIAGSAADGYFFATHFSHEDADPHVQEFIRKYQERFGEIPDGMAALAYDAARILADAIGRAPDLSGAEIAAALADTKDFHGVTGMISIGADRNSIKSAIILEMKDGKPALVTTIPPRE